MEKALNQIDKDIPLIHIEKKKNKGLAPLHKFLKMDYSVNKL
jgi:hypothetical protein